MMLLAEAIDTCEWESYGLELAGVTYPCQRVKRRKTAREVFNELRERLGRDKWGYVTCPGVDEYLTIMTGVDGDMEWPEGRIVVFAVNGTSEGDYVHVEVQNGDSSPCLILGKTFQGRDAAWSAARTIADLLGA